MELESKEVLIKINGTPINGYPDEIFVKNLANFFKSNNIDPSNLTELIPFIQDLGDYQKTEFMYTLFDHFEKTNQLPSFGLAMNEQPFYSAQETLDWYLSHSNEQQSEIIEVVANIVYEQYSYPIETLKQLFQQTNEIIPSIGNKFMSTIDKEEITTKVDIWGSIGDFAFEPIRRFEAATNKNVLETLHESFPKVFETADTAKDFFIGLF